MSGAQIAITKMHGAGNDFVLIERGNLTEDYLPSLAISLCDRHFGIGADGMLVVSPSQLADVRMRIFNSDGSEAQMCGNGIRCVGKYLYDNNIISDLHPTVETLSGIKKLELHLDSTGLVDTVTVDMGPATLLSDDIVALTVQSGTFDTIPVSTGNPHCVIEVDDIDDFDVTTIGPQLENHPYWSEKANIEFITVESSDSIRQRTWERGAGETLACGTGACAAAFAMVKSARTDWPVKVKLPGGILIINIKDDHLTMTGPAVKVFECTVQA